MRRPGPATSAAAHSLDSVACAGASLRTTISGLHKRPIACSVRISQVRRSQSRHPGSPLAASSQAERSRTLLACVRARGGGIRSFNKEQRICMVVNEPDCNLGRLFFEMLGCYPARCGRTRVPRRAPTRGTLRVRCAGRELCPSARAVRHRYSARWAHPSTVAGQALVPIGEQKDQPLCLRNFSGLFRRIFGSQRIREFHRLSIGLWTGLIRPPPRNRN